MAFKDSASFLEKITVGALGTRRARDALNAGGHDVVELDLGCYANKLWQTKVKRLRQPDLICSRCGTRFEVRAKTDLKIVMSHTPSKPTRHWDAGLGDEDVAVFVAILAGESSPHAAGTLNAFEIGDMRASRDRAKEGPPKSQSEGSEIDLTWPSWTPAKSGECAGATAVASAAAEALVRAQNVDVPVLLSAAQGQGASASWALHCLSRLQPAVVMALPQWAETRPDVRSDLEQHWGWARNPFAPPDAQAQLALLEGQMFRT